MGLGLWAEAGLSRHEGPGREVRDPGLVVLRRGLPCAVGPGYPLARLRPRRAGLRFTGKFSFGGWRC